MKLKYGGGTIEATGGQLAGATLAVSGAATVGGTLNASGGVYIAVGNGLFLPPPGAGMILARNSANTAYVDLLYMNTSDTAVIPRALIVSGALTSGALIAPSFSMGGGGSGVGDLKLAYLAGAGGVYHRIAFASDNTGYKFEIAKNVGGVFTSLLTVSDVNVATITNGLSVTGGTLIAAGAFGCNGNAAQTKAVSGGTLAGVIAALVATGILSS